MSMNTLHQTMNDLSTSNDESFRIKSGMSLKLIRIARLKQFAHTRQLVGPVDIGKAIGKKANQTSDLLSGTAPFGEKVARSIEVAAKLPDGWLDEAQDTQRVMLGNDERYTKNISQVNPVNDQPPTLAETLQRLGEVIAASDKLTRAQIKPILDLLLESPEQAAELGARLQATVALQQGQTAPPIPSPETNDFAPPVPSSKFIKTREY